MMISWSNRWQRAIAVAKVRNIVSSWRIREADRGRRGRYEGISFLYLTPACKYILRSYLGRRIVLLADEKS